jgi:iron complex outermembrane recepter protein
MSCVRMRLPVFRTLLALLAASFAHAVGAQSADPLAVREFHIQAQDAVSGLADFGEQSGQQLLFDFDAVQGRRTNAIAGSLRATEALAHLLEGSGLSYDVINPRTISVRRSTTSDPDRVGGGRAFRESGRAATRDRRRREPGAGGNAAAVSSDEIIVTAEKRGKSLQRSAVAVTALGSRVVERQQITDLKSIATLIPNLHVGASSSQAAFDLAMRGIVSTNRTEVGDPAVAFHVDGFYSPRPQGATIVMHDLEHLEVLRGPQGTLFGRNANAGVINVVTAKPVLGASYGALDLTRGSHDLIRTKGHLNLALGETFALRAAAFFEQRDGYIAFLPGSQADASTPRYDDSDKRSVRLSGQWEPTDDWRVFASAERFDDRGTGTIPVSPTPRPGYGLRAALVSSPGRLAMKNDTFHLRVDRFAEGFGEAGLELTYQFGWARMTRTNVSDEDAGLAQDPEIRALPYSYVQPTFQAESRTQGAEFVSTQHELQIKPLDGGPLDWIAGAFFYQEDNSMRFDVDLGDDRGLVPGEADAGDMRYAQSYLQPHRRLGAWAGFGQVTWHAADTLRFSGGARYTHDTKSDRGGVNVVCPGPYATIGSGGFHLAGVATRDIPFAPDPDSPVAVPGTCRITAHNDASRDWSKVTYMARIEHDVTQRLLAYALTSTGFKSGVIQDGGGHAGPEQVVNYELGLKASLLGGAMALNTVAFHSAYSDILRARLEWGAPDTFYLVTRNATRARILGAESELLWKLSGTGELQAVVTYLDSAYRDFPTVDSQFYVASDPLSPVVNLRGNRLPFAPEYTVALVYEHSFRLANGARLAPRLQTRYQSEMFLTDFNRRSDRQEGCTRTDLSLRYEARADWSIEAFVRNLEDEAVKNNVDLRGNQPGSGGVAGFPGVARAFLDAPRTYGLRAAVRFGR